MLGYINFKRSFKLELNIIKWYKNVKNIYKKSMGWVFGKFLVFNISITKWSSLCEETGISFEILSGIFLKGNFWEGI